MDGPWVFFRPQPFQRKMFFKTFKCSTCPKPPQRHLFQTFQSLQTFKPSRTKAVQDSPKHKLGVAYRNLTTSGSLPSTLKESAVKNCDTLFVTTCLSCSRATGSKLNRAGSDQHNLSFRLQGQTFTSRLSCFFFSLSRTGTFEFNSTTSCSRLPRRRAGRGA